MGVQALGKFCSGSAEEHIHGAAVAHVGCPFEKSSLQMAVQIANLFGAGQIIAAGRAAGRLAGLAELGATDTVLLEGMPTRSPSDSARPPPMSTS